MVQALTHNAETRRSPWIALMSEEQYVEFWPFIEKELEKVPHIWEPWFTLAYLRQVPVHQELLVWHVGVEGAMKIVIFGQFIGTPRGKGLSFVLALGNGLDECAELLEGTFERIAQASNCDYVEIRGRPGWERKFKGFKRDYVVMSRQLQNFQVQ